MRYERRDPRPEDLRQIDELKSIVDSQEKDIFYLTEQLRDFQLQQQNQTNLQNTNQSKKSKGNKNNKNINGINKSDGSNNGNSNNDAQPQMRHHAEPQQTKQSANHERMKPPPLIKTIIYEEENENELYEQQIREERENAKKNQEFETELQSQQNGVMVELMPESPDYTTKNTTMEEISEAHLISDQESIIPDVVVLPSTSPDDKNREIRIEVISTIEPSNIQIVSNGNVSMDELD